ncbi:MAG: hypothetical protein ACRD1K_19420, partial [Acidimicrobiales bacterium]
MGGADPGAADEAGPGPLSRPRAVRVLPDARSLDKAFDYLVPDEFADRVRVGTVVRVPLHGRRVRGWVVADEVTPPEGVRLLPLAGVVGQGPPPDVVELSTWAAHRWAGRRSSFLRTGSPPAAAVRRGELGAGSHAGACDPHTAT